MDNIKILLIIAFSTLTCKETISLRITRLEVPPAIANGQPALLFCNYDLEQESLYSVKFYKNYVEFYRYMPNDLGNPRQKLKTKGVYPDLSRSNATHVVLSHTDLDSEGYYACEVSTDAPSYSTTKAVRQMKVYVLPNETLKIDGYEEQYHPDDKINVTCKSGESSPAPNVTWFINDNLADEDQLIRYPPIKTRNGLQSTKLGLIFQPESRHFYHRSELKLRCVATLTLVYDFEAVETISGGYVKNKSNGMVTLNNADWSALPDRETPKIRGGKRHYHVNDVLNKNCTSDAHDAQLKWFIDSAEANASQLIKYDGRGKNQVLGLRFFMEQQYFQVPELKLRCVASFHRTIADFKTELVIRTYNELPGAGPINSNSSFLVLSGCLHFLATIVIIAMQKAYFAG